MEYFFRMPEFPILVDLGTELVAVGNPTECDERLDALSLPDNEPRPVIDATAEGFAFYPEFKLITPLTVKKSWTKAEIVELYNARKPSALPLFTRSLPTRRLSRIVAEIVDLLRSDAPGRI